MMYEKLINDLHLLQKQLFWIKISFDEVLAYTSKLIAIMNTTIKYIENIKENR